MGAFFSKKKLTKKMIQLVLQITTAIVAVYARPAQDLSDDEDFATDGSGYGSGDFSGDFRLFSEDDDDAGHHEFSLGEINMVTWIILGAVVVTALIFIAVVAKCCYSRGYSKGNQRAD